MKLTQSIVDNALYEGESYMSRGGRKKWREQILWDDGLPGLGLRITQTNLKTFVVTYRADGRKRRKTLGKAGKLTLAHARERAAELLQAADPEPPAAPARAASAEVETVAELADAYLEQHLKLHTPTWFTEQRLIRSHIQPAMGRTPLAEVTRNDLTSLRTRVARKFPADARKLATLVNGMFDWAADRGLWSGESPSEPGAGKRAGKRKAGKRKTGKAGKGRGSGSAPAAAAEQLAGPLAESERQREELADQLRAVTESGAQMMSELNELAAARRKLEAKLARAERELERARSEAESPEPEDKAARTVANLRESVQQLMESLNVSEGVREEQAARLAKVEGHDMDLAEKVTSLVRERNALEGRLRDAERQVAQRKRDQGRGRALSWVAGGLAGGALLMFFLQLALRAVYDEAPAGGVEAPVTVERAETIAPEESPAEQPSPSAGASEPAGPEPEPVTPPPGPEPGLDLDPDLDTVESVVGAWADAWAGRRVDEYLAFYGSEFRPPGGLGRSAWEAQRRTRISRPASIRLSLGPIRRTVVEPGRVRASFDQAYAAGSYSDQVSKTLELVWEDGAWKIAAELSD